MIELLGRHYSRELRRQIADESRHRMEAELGKPLSDLAGAIWNAFDQISKNLLAFGVIAVGATILLALNFFFVFADEFDGRSYVTSKRSLVKAAAVAATGAATVVIWVLSRKVSDARAKLRERLPNLYVAERQLAELISKDALLRTVNSEYKRQSQFALEYVEGMRASRLERERWRTEAERRRAEGAINVPSVEAAEEVLRQRLVSEFMLASDGTHWAAAVLSSERQRSASLLPPRTCDSSARFALFLCAPCRQCGRGVSCSTPYQLRFNPVNGDWRHAELFADIPPPGEYIIWPVQDGMVVDVVDGGWYCVICAKSV